MGNPASPRRLVVTALDVHFAFDAVLVYSKKYWFMYRDTDNHFFHPQTNIQYGIERNLTFKKSVSQSVSFCICMSSILSSIVLPKFPLIVHRQSPSNVLSNASTVLLNIADVSFKVSSHAFVAENNN